MALPLSLNLPEFNDEYDGRKMRELASEIERLHASYVAEEEAAPTVSSLGDLSDVDLTGALDNDLLYRSGGNWVPTVGNLTWDGSHLVLPFENDNVTPTLAFGDGDTGFYETIDDRLNLVLAGAVRTQWQSNFVQFGANTTRAGIYTDASTATNPVFTPNLGDSDTGIGWAAADQLSLIAGGVEGIGVVETGLATTDQVIIFPGVTTRGAAATPSLAFGDGDTGFFESADDTLTLTVGATSRFVFSNNALDGNVTNGPRFLNGTPSATSPTLMPNKTDTNTGIGRAAADQLSLIAGGVEGARVEATQFTMGNYIFDTDQSLVGADGYVLTYDSVGGLISLEPAASIADGTIEAAALSWNSSAGAWQQSNRVEIRRDNPVVDNQALIWLDPTTTTSIVRPQIYFDSANAETTNWFTRIGVTGSEGFYQKVQGGGAAYLAWGHRNTSAASLDVVRITEGRVFQYDNGTGLAEVATVNDISQTLGDLTDVDLTGAADNDLLYRSGGNWVDTAGNLTWDGSHLVLLQQSDALTPTLAFGDGDSGFYESIDDVIRVSLLAADRFRWQGDQFRSHVDNGPAMVNSNAAATTAVFLPDLTDTDTGIGQAGDDQLSLIAGGLELMRLTEDAAGAGNTVQMQNYIFDIDQSTAGADGYVLTYDSVGGLISLEPAAGGATVIDDLTDVNTTGSADFDLLYKSAGNWIDTGGNLKFDGQSLISTNGVEASPGFAFGDGDTGFFELSDDLMRLSIGGTARFQFFLNGPSTPQITGTSSSSFHCSNVAASRTTASLGPRRSTGMGLGSASSEEMSLIVEGLEFIRLFESPTSDRIELQYANFLKEIAAVQPDLTGYGQLYALTTDGGLYYKPEGSAAVRLDVTAASTLGDLTDVDLTGAANNDLLYRSGGNWVDTAGELTWDGTALTLAKSTTDAAIYLKADTSNTVETANPFIRFEQDGNAVATVIGSVGGADLDAQGNVFTGMTNNGFAIHQVYSSGAIAFGVNGAVGLSIDLNNDITVSGRLDFGDSDTGFYESIDDVLRVTVGGVDRFRWSSGQFRSDSGNGPAMVNANAAAATPVFLPDLTDTDTGIGQAAADQLSLIAGGLELMRLTEDAAGAGNTVQMQNYIFDIDQSLAGADGYVLTYDSGDGQISLEPVTGGGNVSNTGTPANNQIAVWNSSTVIRGESDFTWDGVHLVMNVPTGDATTPTLAFGAGGVGIYENSSNVLGFATNATARFLMGTLNTFEGALAGSAAILNEDATTTNPTLCPDKSDLNTGLGTGAADQMSIIAGGIEMAKIVEGTTDYWDFLDKEVRRVQLKDYSLDSTSVTPTGTAQTITYSTSNSYEVDLESVTGTLTITISGGPPTGTYGQMIVKVTQDSTTVRAVNWSGGTFEWAGGTEHEVTSTLNGFTIFTFETWNGGSTWFGSGADYS